MSRKCNRINAKGKICRSPLTPRPSKSGNLQEWSFWWEDGRVEGIDGDGRDTGCAGVPLNLYSKIAKMLSSVYIYHSLSNTSRGAGFTT